LNFWISLQPPDAEQDCCHGLWRANLEVGPETHLDTCSLSTLRDDPLSRVSGVYVRVHTLTGAPNSICALEHLGSGGKSSGQKKSVEIIDRLKTIPTSPEWTLSRRLACNPLRFEGS